MVWVVYKEDCYERGTLEAQTVQSQPQICHYIVDYTCVWLLFGVKFYIWWYLDSMIGGLQQHFHFWKALGTPTRFRDHINPNGLSDQLLPCWRRSEKCCEGLWKRIHSWKVGCVVGRDTSLLKPPQIVFGGGSVAVLYGWWKKNHPRMLVMSLSCLSCLLVGRWEQFLGAEGNLLEVTFFIPKVSSRTRWWQLKNFLFSPLPWKWSNLTNIFPNGLKPPTGEFWTCFFVFFLGLRRKRPKFEWAFSASMILYTLHPPEIQRGILDVGGFYNTNLLVL